MIYWTFMDYYEGGRNQVSEWLDGLPPSQQKAVKAALNAILLDYRFVRELKPPKFKMLAPGIGEIRFQVGNVQHRPLYTRGPGRDEITILLGAREVNHKMVPPTAIRIATERAAQIHLTGKVKEHDYS